ncbi:DNA cytosine methyltransferase [Serratia marcescens]|uniref:DNA cytosine methyltransferase n=1 Tax=Serratia marcescens TaxID=615 RepID=UPI000A83A4CA|nr:DNA cytosine methyltransferase [Serratia marcescens]MDM8342072.1 DNA cytosine methyltransferase [Serratia marcescens]QIO26062.1 DNA cytosine methyltransferase [Serratia marcescens]HCR2979374.1 DNA cytosine methyltransferase [Serratia marcescens]
MKVVDLFAGCGGLSLGFESAGLDIVLAVELWEPARKVYQKNFSHPVYDLDLSQVVDAVRIIEKEEPDIIIGGPPCQEFSMAGSRIEGDKAKLTYNFAEIISQVKPKWFVLENVPGAMKSITWKNSRAILEESGYGITETILNASYFGVPQNRRRFFAIGCLGEENNFIKKEIENKINPTPLTIREYAGKEFDIEYYYRHPRNWGRKGIFSIDEPAPTVRSTIRQVPPGYNAHPDDAGPLENARALDVRERATIQTFPKDFDFFGTLTDQNIMVANAVPVLLAKHIADSVRKYEGVLVEQDLEIFRGWLKECRGYTSRTASNVLSRLKRVSHIVNIRRKIKDASLLINSLNKSIEFNELTISVKSQIRKAIKLKGEFDSI